MSALFFQRLLKMVLRTIVTLMEVAKALLISSVDFTIFIQTFGEKRATAAGGMQSGPRAGQTLKRFVAVQLFPLHPAVHQKVASVTCPSSKPWRPQLHGAKAFWTCQGCRFPVISCLVIVATTSIKGPWVKCLSLRALASPQAA